MKKLLTILVVVAMVSPAFGDWTPASVSDGVIEIFDDVMSETDTTVPQFLSDDFVTYDTHWKVTQNNNDFSLNLALPGSWPSNGGYNMGTVQAFHGNINDRALGAYSGDQQNRTVQLKMVNDTGAAMDEIFVRFDLERWIARSTSRPGMGRLELSYGGSSTVLTDYVTIPGVDQPYWDNAAYGEPGFGWVYGNNADNALRNLGGLIDLSALGVSIADGDEFDLVFRLSKTDSYDTKQTGLAVDNVIVAVPEPATMSLLALGGLGALIRRRRS
jgi:hypothetical protein